MRKRLTSPSIGTQRIPPADAPSDAVDRIVPRLSLEAGDIIVYRERVPRLAASAKFALPLWRYRVFVHPDRRCGRVFNGFQHAASEAQQLASASRARVVYVEDDVPSLHADYRKRR